jgi:hypothetical protein
MAMVYDCSATGNVESTNTAGGFAGHIEDGADVRRCSARGDVLCTNTFAGGFSGDCINYEGAIQERDCYAWGNVVAGGGHALVQDYEHESPVFVDSPGGVSGFAGNFQYENAVNIYSIGTVGTNDATKGGLVGTNENDTSTVTAGFWDTQSSGVSVSALGEGHNTYWMQTKANYLAAGWDFDTVWEMPDEAPRANDNYPVIKITSITNTFIIPGD